MVELGNKHQCPECDTKFYDLGKSEKLCPKCGFNVTTGAMPGEAEADDPKPKPKTKKKKKKKTAKGKKSGEEE